MSWWNQNIKISLLKKEVLKIYKTKHLDDFIYLKTLKVKSKYLIKIIEKIAWEKFISSINKNVDSKII